jgi:hypothetical protein
MLPARTDMVGSSTELQHEGLPRITTPGRWLVVFAVFQAFATFESL